MEESNKRIFKNTIYLYVRQIVIVALSFISTRIVLDKLGASDYGVNNVVSGFVAMFTVLNNILQTGTRRFLFLYLGKKDSKPLKNTFSTCFVIHLVTGITVILCLETIGLWFLNSHLNIEPDRMTAANWVFQFSVLTVFLGITQTPFVAAITAHEHFNIYAYMSIYEAVAKILVLFVLVYLSGDKLIIYGTLQMFVVIISIGIYGIYCIRKFKECSFSLHVDRDLLKKMISFSGWSVLGNLFAIGNYHGFSILLNIFFNTAINASRGLAATVTFTISQFVGGFIIAGEPQLVKSYGAGEKEEFERLVFNITQYTLFLLSLITVPVFMETDYVLGLWLGKIPPYTSDFIKITILCSFITNSYIMLNKAIIASGYMKQLALIVNTIPIIQLPLIYCVLKLGYEPTAAYWITLVPEFIAMFADMWIIKKYISFPSGRFFIQVFAKNFILILVACIIPYIIHNIMHSGLFRFLVVCTLSVVSTLVVMWLFALNDEIKNQICRKVIKGRV